LSVTDAPVAEAYRRVVASRTGERRAHDQIERVCATAQDVTGLRVDVLELVRTVVDFDAHVWLLTDPRTTVGSAPLAVVPCLPELALTIRLKYLTEVNRWTRLEQDRVVVGTLLEATDGQPSRSLMWRDVLSRYDIGDMASVVFANRFGVWGFLDLWRSTSQPSFSSGDTSFLRGVAATLTTALQRCQARTLTAPAAPAGRELGPVVFLLDDDLRVLSQTPAGDSWLEILLPSSPDNAPVPASVYNVAAQLLAIEHGIDSHPAMARVHLVDGFWVTLRAGRLDRLQPGQRGAIAVTIEETSPVDRLEVFSRAYALSTREHELMGLLATGGDTRTLAARMSLAEHTVQDHLKSVFAKTSARSRAALLARAVGVSSTATTRR
jgi:DNA-binding CsgD family transcriptional regulator